MTTVRQPCSMPQSGWTSGVSRCLARQTGCSSASGRSWYSSSGKISFIEPPEALVELLVAAAGVGEQEAALLDVVADVLPGRGGELRGVVAVEEEDRRLEQVRQPWRCRGRRPARSAGSSSRGRRCRRGCARRRGRCSSRRPGPWRSLLISTGARPLARNSRAKLVASIGSFSYQRPLPEPAELVLVVHQLLGAQAIPVVSAEEPDARRAGRPAPGHRGSRYFQIWPVPKFWPTWKWPASQSIPRWRLPVDRRPCRSSGSSRPGGIPAPGTA